MRPIRRSVVLLGSAFALPLGLVACSSSNSNMAMGCGSNTKVTVTGGTITYTPQTSVLQTAGVATTAVSPATISNGALQLPISGGSVNNSSLAGTINTKGGVTFAAPGGRSVTVTNLSVNTQNGVLSGQVNGQSVQLLQPAGSPTAYSGLVRGTISTASNSSKPINFSAVPQTVIAAGGTALNQGLAVSSFTSGAQAGTISSSITYSC